MASPQQSSKAVPPAWKLCELPNIAAFSTGTWNGKPHDSAFLRKIVDNFRKYSSGPNPYYQPYISLNHKDELRSGHISGARLEGSELLRLDGRDIPEPVGAWRNAGGLVQPSIEYFEPVYDETGKLIDGFRKPDGTIEDGPVLKCLTLLGADAPAVKGLPPLPMAVQQFRYGGRVRRFSNGGRGMDRAAMIAALQTMGVDVTGITDVVPDEVIKAWLDSLQAAKSGPPPADTVPDANAVMPMADAVTGTGAALALPTPAPAPTTGAAPGQQPTQVVYKFNDNNPVVRAQAFQQFIADQVAQTNQLRAIAAQATQQLAAVNNAASQQARAAKFADVTAFVNALAKPDEKGMVRILPAQKPGFITMLMELDNVRVRKFADGKSSGSALDEMKQQLTATLPKIKATGERMADPAPHVPGGTPGGGMDPARRAAVLQGTPQGRAILAKEAAAAKTAGK